jgi:eukaryotic-like serine/threonine-protein kinase
MERIGEYLVRRLVGEGGMGKVYEAEERLSHRRVALKVLRPELSRSEDGRRLFVNEMMILAHLDHPHVVRCLSCSEVDGQLVMALEFLDGRTLRELLIEQGALGRDETVALAAQIASALDAAHRQEPPIVHRDLKPENVMIGEDGNVKVMDFGIAKVLQAVSKTTTQSVGTLAYMSPEQIDATGVDGRSDLYCLGLLLYEMIAGKPPFASASPRELLNMQCTEAPPPLPDTARHGLPKGVERLIFELLQKSPDDRPGSAEDVLGRLEPFAPAAGAPPRSIRRAAEPERAKEPADAEASSARDPAPAAPPGRADTIALVDRVGAPREVSRRTGVAIVVALSVLAGVASYFVRAHHGSSDSQSPTDPSAASVERAGGAEW